MSNNLSLIQSNAKNIPLRDKSVQCIVTSPPYFGLRDYGTAEWVGGDADCDHTIGGWNDNKNNENVDRPERDGKKRQNCLICGANRIDKQIGLEETLQEYIDSLMNVFNECWRVLKDDGTLWLNLGDSYAGNNSRASNNGRAGYGTKREGVYTKGIGDGFKQKDLMGVPWRVAIALQDRGWYLRSDIIWHKPNVMPESVRDRPTKTHEYIFLLTKNKKYYYDIEAIKEDSIDKESYIGRSPRNVHQMAKFDKKNYKFAGSINEDGTLGDVGKTYPKRNRRTVWKISTKSYKGAHFATFPPELPKICILAGTSKKGECPVCGKAWKRKIEKKRFARNELEKDDPRYRPNVYDGAYKDINGKGDAGYSVSKTIGWEIDCDHNLGPVPQIVLDPFGGSGTTAMVARNLGRYGISFDISWEYLQLAKERVGNKQLEEWKTGKKVEENWQDLPMFGENN